MDYSVSMLKYAMALLMASMTAGFYWNDPAYESFLVNSDNRLRPEQPPSYYRLPPDWKEHCSECREIRDGKQLTLEEYKAYLKRHVLDEDDYARRKCKPPPYYISR